MPHNRVRNRSRTASRQSPSTTQVLTDYEALTDHRTPEAARLRQRISTLVEASHFGFLESDTHRYLIDREGELYRSPLSRFCVQSLFPRSQAS